MRLTGLTATEFTLLFAAAALLAVVFYLLSFRRRLAVVAADPIWRKVAGRHRTPYRKLLALLGQIFILFLMALALGDPRSRQQGLPPPVAAVVVVDVSASMGAYEADGTRLDRARKVVHAIAGEVGPADRVLVMTMDDSCRPLTPFTNDVALIRRVADEMLPSALPENPLAAMNFSLSALQAAGLADDVRRRIVLISDRFHDLPDEAVPEDISLLQVAVGTVRDNLAVTAFDVRSRTGAAKGSELFVEVTNFGATSRRARLGIHTPEHLLGEVFLTVPAAGRMSRSYFLKPLEEQRILATLTSTRGGGTIDHFSLDDRAYAEIPRKQTRKVVLVTEGNLYLSKALSLNPTIRLVTVSPRSLGPAVLADAQAVIYDGLCPGSDRPAAYFNPRPDPACPFALGQEVKHPRLLPMRGDHPITDGITLIDVQIHKASRLVPEAGDAELLSDAGGPLVIARKKNGIKLLAFGFDVTQSDLPLRIAYPMMLHNLLGWFLGDVDDPGLRDSSVGALLALPAWVGPHTSISQPGGKPVAPKRIGNRWLLRPRLPGFYTASQGAQRWQAAVNFYLQAESDLSGDRNPGPSRLLWTGEESGDDLGAVLAGFDKREHPKPPPQWPLLLLAAAWLLLFDWIFYCFRILF